MTNSKPHTHYDNLRVSRNAPEEVIRAAYRALAQKYHPDVNSDPDASRIMTIINQSYAVLSDPTKRAAHDRWIAVAESTTTSSTPPTEPTRPTEDGASSSNGYKRTSVWRRVVAWWPTYVIAIAYALYAVEQNGPSNSPAQLPLPSTPEATKPTPLVTQPGLPLPSVPAQPVTKLADSASPTETGTSFVAPNGRKYPLVAGHIDGYPKKRGGGLCSLTVDNTAGGTPAFVRLWVLGSRSEAVRTIYVAEGKSFKISGLQPGTYDVRYADANFPKSATKSEAFELTQRQTDKGTEFSVVTLTLYTVSNGNSRHSTISLSEL